MYKTNEFSSFLEYVVSFSYVRRLLEWCCYLGKDCGLPSYLYLSYSPLDYLKTFGNGFDLRKNDGLVGLYVN